jgi:hypothetical protein
LAPYGGNNSLRLPVTNNSGTLVFTTPLPAVSLYMLATGGSGACTVNATVNFADATTQTFTNLSISDWYNGANFAIQGFGRINRTNDVLENGGGTNPRLYQIPFAISVANQAKLINSVTITKSGGVGIANIMGLSADAYTGCPGPINITVTSTPDGGIFNWTAPVSAPSNGYQYYYSTSATPPTAATTPTGYLAAGVTTLTLTGLPMGVTHYLWVRSDCGATQGFWQLKVFTTGQVVTTYTAGDINTEYNLTPTLTSTTACPGIVTITVPAGYQIAGTDVSYTMTTASNGWMSEQRTLLVCTTNSTTEAAIASGVGGATGTYSYNRTGLNIANGLTGSVTYNLRAWRTYGGSGCSAEFNKVDNNSLRITVTLNQLLSSPEAAAQRVKVYPAPFTDLLHLDHADEVKTISFTDLTGKVVRTVEHPSPTIQLEDLASGLYLLRMTMQDGTIQHTKAIKQ